MLFVFFLVASNGLKEIYIIKAIFLLSKMASIHRTNYPFHEKIRSHSFTLCNKKHLLLNNIKHDLILRRVYLIQL